MKIVDLLKVRIIVLLSDIRFWIIFFFIIRLYGITNPPLEVAHNWRQTTVTMVARNFLEVDNNILYPRIDIAGEKTGITGMEFPFLNYLIYLVSLVFGYQHWYGRLINLIVSSIGLLFYSKTIKLFFDEKVTFYSTIILAVSIWFQYSRKIMPDTFSMTFIITSIYYGMSYFYHNNRLHKYSNLLLYLILLIIGGLSKLPSIYLLVVFLFPFIDKSKTTNEKFIFIAVTFLALIPICYWYFIWVPFLVHKYGFWHFFMGIGIHDSFQQLLTNKQAYLFKFYDEALKYIGFSFFIIGILIGIVRKDKKVLWLFLLTFLSFGLIILKSGYNFTKHSYYIVPFVPIMAILSAYALSVIKNTKLAIFFLILISMEGILNQFHDFKVKGESNYFTNLEFELDKVCKPSDLIIINSDEFPTPMYFAHRKGWVSNNQNISNRIFIDSLERKGLKYILILKSKYEKDIELTDYQILLNNSNYCIYRVNNNI